jgi:hypothetical protein
MLATLRRDYTAETKDLPAIRLGSVPVAADLPGRVADLFGRGVRHVTLDGVVDLAGDPAAGEAAVTGLVLVRELTSFGIVVRWRLRVPAETALPWLLGHLFPPAEVLGSPHGDQLAELWRRRFHLGKCFWRQGPGFIEVRDHRSARPARITITDPERLAAVEVMSAGAAAGDVPAPVLDEFAATGLSHQVGRSVWWTPYRIRRWPTPPLAV